MCFVQMAGLQTCPGRLGLAGPVITALLADWPEDKLKEAKASGSLIEASEVADVVMFMLTRPPSLTICDVVMLPTNFDL
jgi:ribitol 2-dehydrogenase